MRFWVFIILFVDKRFIFFFIKKIYDRDFCASAPDDGFGELHASSLFFNQNFLNFDFEDDSRQALRR